MLDKSKYPDCDRSTKHLRADHKEFEIKGKPAVVFNHMQVGLAGGGSFTRNWSPNAMEQIKRTGFVENCQLLARTFREMGLPVIFVNAVPDPFGKMPQFGDLANELRATFDPRGNPNWYTDEWYRKGMEVMPEMEFDSKTDYCLYNWLVHPFTNSGLDVVMRANDCKTIIWAGYAQHSACTTAVLVAADYWFNNILPVDASPVIVPPTLPGYYPGLDDLVAEVTVKVQAPQAAHCTDTDTVLEKLKKFNQG